VDALQGSLFQGSVAEVYSFAWKEWRGFDSTPGVAGNVVALGGGGWAEFSAISFGGVL
jgi:hypothetical protein